MPPLAPKTSVPALLKVMGALTVPLLAMRPRLFTLLPMASVLPE